MGWASGSDIALEIIRAAMQHVPPTSRVHFYRAVIKALESEDWDTQDEALGLDPLFDEAMKDAHPDWDIDE